MGTDPCKRAPGRGEPQGDHWRSVVLRRTPTPWRPRLLADSIVFWKTSCVFQKSRIAFSRWGAFWLLSNSVNIVLRCYLQFNPNGARRRNQSLSQARGLEAIREQATHTSSEFVKRLLSKEFDTCPKGVGGHRGVLGLGVVRGSSNDGAGRLTFVAGNNLRSVPVDSRS